MGVCVGSYGRGACGVARAWRSESGGSTENQRSGSPRVSGLTRRQPDDQSSLSGLSWLSCTACAAGVGPVHSSCRAHARWSQARAHRCGSLRLGTPAAPPSAFCMSPCGSERHAWAREAGGAQDRVRVRSLSLQGTSNWACLMLLILPPGAKLMWERREQQEAAPPWAPSRASLRNHNPGCAPGP